MSGCSNYDGFAALVFSAVPICVMMRIMVFHRVNKNLITGLLGVFLFNLVGLSILCAAGGWWYVVKMSVLNTFFAVLVPYIYVIAKEKFERRR
jgi:hypothetical protein